MSNATISRIGGFNSGARLVKKNAEAFEAKAIEKAVLSPAAQALVDAGFSEKFAGAISVYTEIACNTSGHVTIPVIPCTNEVFKEWAANFSAETLAEMLESANTDQDRYDSPIQTTPEQKKAARAAVKEMANILKELKLSDDDCCQSVATLNASGVTGRFNVAYISKDGGLVNSENIKAGHYDSVRIPNALLRYRCNRRMSIKKELDTLIKTYLILEKKDKEYSAMYAAIPSGKIPGSKDLDSEEGKAYIAYRNDILAKIAEKKNDPSILAKNEEYAGLSWMKPHTFEKLDLPVVSIDGVSELEMKELMRFMLPASCFLPLWQENNKTDMYLMVAYEELKRRQANPDMRESQRGEWLNEVFYKDYKNPDHQEFVGLSEDDLKDMTPEQRDRAMVTLKEIVSRNDLELHNFIVMKTVDIVMRSYECDPSYSDTVNIKDIVEYGTGYTTVEEAAADILMLINGSKWAEKDELLEKPWAKDHTSGLKYTKKIFGSEDEYEERELTAASVFFKLQNVLERNEIIPEEFSIDLAHELHYKSMPVYQSYVEWITKKDEERALAEAKRESLKESVESSKEINYLVGPFACLNPFFDCHGGAKIWDDDGVEYPSITAMVESRRAASKKERLDLISGCANMGVREQNREIIARFRDQYKDGISYSMYTNDFFKTAIIATVRRTLVDDDFRKALTVIAKENLKFADSALDTVTCSKEGEGVNNIHKGYHDIYLAVGRLLLAGLLPTWDQCVSVFGENEAK